ncbi:hypothetical protein V6N11_018879 [Hibiscus sabdariffa]|uniref:Uncharacterized protein n=1 Tax=Hibiscus sabdariffa TaxID=183260 RepID=A0ABR1ZS28_9ROSI
MIEISDSGCMGENFNMVWVSEEHQGYNSVARGMAALDEFLLVAGCVDVPVIKKKFTWFCLGNRCYRLDHFVVMGSWVNIYNDIKQYNLPRGTTDHSPLLLVERHSDCGPRPFHFLNV